MLIAKSLGFVPGQFPIELELLLKTIQASGDSQTEEEVRNLAAQALDWGFLIKLAQRHHVLPLLYANLKKTAWNEVPDGARSYLAGHYTRNLKCNFRLMHHASRILRTFTEQSIRVLPYKGIFLAASVYGQASSREVNDIDLLIAPEDRLRSGDLLLSMGFTPTITLEQEQVYRDRDRQIEIDLHWQLAPTYFSTHYNFDQLWKHSLPTHLGGLAYRGLSAEDLLLLLCIQISKDSWEQLQRLEQLQKLCDIAQLIRQTPSLNWNSLRQSVKQQGLSRIVNVALALAADLLNCPLPQEVRANLNQDHKALALARRLSEIQNLASTAPAPGSNSPLNIPLRLRQLMFYLQLRERQRDKWQHLIRIATMMTGVNKAR